MVIIVTICVEIEILILNPHCVESYSAIGIPERNDNSVSVSNL